MKEINLQLKDWLYNAGLVGFTNILLHAKDEVTFNGQFISFKEEVLEGFEEKYLNYLIDTYEKTLSWHKIVRFKEFIEKHEEEEYLNFAKNDLDILNNYIGTESKSGTLKYYLVSNSLQAAYKLISSELDLVLLSKQISTIRIKNNEEISDKLSDVKEAIDKIKIIINYFEEPNAKKYIGAKNVMYTIIKNAWNGVSFLNSQTKIPDMYEDYKKYFLSGLENYINEDNSGSKYKCSICSNKMKDMNNNLSFLNATGFDTNRKPSHVWNFNNDIATCPMCNLIYSCVPAGFTYVYDKGIFINQNQNTHSAIKINQSIKSEVLENKDIKNIWTVYQLISEQLNTKMNESTKYELADIQVVRYVNDNDNYTYRFNLLSKKTLLVLKESATLLKPLIKTGYKEINTHFNIYDDVMKRIINNENLFLLIHKILIQKITKPSDSYYHFGHIYNVLKINYIFLKGVVGMEKKEKDILELSKNSGYYFKKAYIEKSAENKISGIAYKLLNALKTNNFHMFMDTLINCYLYIKQSVPRVFVDGMNNEYEFKSIGYAFVSGITSEIVKSDKDNGGE